MMENHGHGTELKAPAPNHFHTFTASAVAISEVEQSDIYMTITMRMLTTKPNLNGDRVTEAFIDEIVANQDRYQCIPLVADVHKIENGDLKGLGHMLDAETGAFMSQQIGSFYSFEKTTENGYAALVGIARVAKRNKSVMEAITKLFADGRLNFSFEILAGETTKDGAVTVIDVSEHNHLIGLCVVTHPADVSARALALVAEADDEKAMSAAFEHTKYVSIAEASLESVRQWVWQAVRMFFGDEAWEMNVERVCADCAILYHIPSAKTFKMEYVVQNERMVVTDVYEAVLQRKEGADEVQNDNENMELEQTATPEASAETAEAQATEQETPAAETASEETPAVEAEPAQTEEAAGEPAEQEDAPNTASTADEVEIDTLRERVRVLEEQLEQQAKVIAEHDRAAKAKKVATVAKRAGLDTEDAAVKAAIESADMDAITTMIAEAPEAEDAADEHVTEQNPFVAEMTAGGSDMAYLFAEISEEETEE